MHGPKPYKLIGFGGMHGPKPYKLMGFGGMHGPKPYKLIGFGDTHTHAHTLTHVFFTFAISPTANAMGS